MIEFEIKGDLAQVKNSVIDANFEEISKWLNNELSVYKTMIVTPENLPSAKINRAQIRRIAQRIDEQRKIVKKAYMQPFTIFEDKCRDLKSICDEASNHLDTQIKAFEEEQKTEKKKQLIDYWNSKYALKEDTAASYIAFENIFDSRWLNAAYSTDKAKADIDMAVKNCDEDIKYIRALDKALFSALINDYAKHLNLVKTLKLYEKLKSVKEREEKRSAVYISAKTDELDRREAVIPPAQSTARGERLIEVDFRVWCTETQLNELGSYMRGKNIKYGRVPKEV